jgi:pimeloyl-ACP methyl ester carboxylesterase
VTRVATGPEATLVITRPDGRKLAVDSLGAPRGFPVFLMHGTPGSRRGPRPRASVLYRLGIRLICYDRPGYGGSDRYPGRSVADAAEDVQVIAETLDLGTFSVVGRSGGAPHALACAAELSGWVASVVTLVGLAPPDAPDFDWYSGMTQSNKDEFNWAELSARDVTATLTERAEKVSANPEVLLDLLRPELTRADSRIVDEVAIQQLLTESYSEALRQGAEGWIDDSLALRKPWGFDPRRIKAPVLIWHGLDDVFSPPAHARWLADHITADRDDARVEVMIQRNAAHFDAVKVLPDVLTWAKNAARSEGLRIDGTHQPPFGPEGHDVGVILAD